MTRWRRSYSSKNAHIFLKNSSLGLWIRHSTWRRLQSLREVAVLQNARIRVSFLLTGMTQILIWLIDLYLIYILLISRINITFIALYFLVKHWQNVLLQQVIVYREWRHLFEQQSRIALPIDRDKADFQYDYIITSKAKATATAPNFELP